MSSPNAVLPTLTESLTTSTSTSLALGLMLTTQANQAARTAYEASRRRSHEREIAAAHAYYETLASRPEAATSHASSTLLLESLQPTAEEKTVSANTLETLRSFHASWTSLQQETANAAPSTNNQQAAGVGHDVTQSVLEYISDTLEKLQTQDETHTSALRPTI